MLSSVHTDQREHDQPAPIDADPDPRDPRDREARVHRRRGSSVTRNKMSRRTRPERPRAPCTSAHAGVKAFTMLRARICAVAASPDRAGGRSGNGSCAARRALRSPPGGRPRSDQGLACQAPHLLYCLSGRMKVVMGDGSEGEIGPGDVASIDPDHDAGSSATSPAWQLTLEASPSTQSRSQTTRGSRLIGRGPRVRRRAAGRRRRLRGGRDLRG